MMKGHGKEISCIEWSNNRSNGPVILTSSWDGSIKSWDGVNGSNISMVTPDTNMPGNIIYCVSWSPTIPGTFCSSSSDGSLNVYDLNEPSSSMKGAIKIPASNSELLSCDWNKYNQNIIVTSSVDGLINGFDIRFPSSPPLFVLPGHSRAIKRVKCSPFKESIIASVSYDFTTRIWDVNHLNANVSPLVLTMQNHTEFVYGLDFSIHQPDVLVDCAWDQSVVISSLFAAPQWFQLVPYLLIRIPLEETKNKWNFWFEKTAERRNVEGREMKKCLEIVTMNVSWIFNFPSFRAFLKSIL